MFYALNENVYLVKGTARSCIYNFNSSKLYSLNRALSEKVDLVNRGSISQDTIDNDLFAIFEEFIQNGILTLSKKPASHYIEEIRLPDTGCSFAWVEITSKCNLKCRHCYNESDGQCTVAMSVHDYKLVIDKLLHMGIERIQIIGGEPFFDKKSLRAMLDYTIGKFRFIEIFTNGTLIDATWFKFLSENNIHVALSVYSYREDIHDAVTGFKGSFSRTNRTIAALEKHDIPYRVCNVLMKNVALGEKTTTLYELSEEKDIVRMSGRASFSLLSEDLIRKKLITKTTFNVPIKKHFSARLISGHNCFSDRIYVSADMKVFPCVMERRLKHCEINENCSITLDTAIRNFNKDQINSCSQCEYRYACFDCRPNSLSRDLNEKPWYCTYDPMTGEWENEDEFIFKLKAIWGK